MTVGSILVVNMNYFGDALMTTPAIRALKKAYPSATIDVIAGATSTYLALEVLKLDPDIDNLIPRIDGGSLARGWQLYNVIVKGHYSLVVILPTLPFYCFIAWITGTPVFMVPKADETKHMADHMLDSLAGRVPVVAGPRSVIVKASEEAANRASSAFSHLDRSRRLVACNVGASRPQKRWPVGHFAKLARLVVDNGMNLLVLGGDFGQDRIVSEAVRSQLAGDFYVDRVVDLVGKTDMDELSAVIESADVLVTCDTGAMHIASGVGTPIVALFGSTSSSFTGPFCGADKVRVLDLHLACAPCGTHPTCHGRFDCMTGIEPETVLESILQLMTTTEESAPCTAL